MSEHPIYGGCLCGGVRYEVGGPPRASLVCHCASCRKAAGAQSVAWAVFPSSSFSFVSGNPATYRSSAAVERSFCGGCGTTLTYRHDSDPRHVDVSTASLDDPGAFPPTHHTWLEDKVGWEVPGDGLPGFERSGSPG